MTSRKGILTTKGTIPKLADFGKSSSTLHSMYKIKCGLRTFMVRNKHFNDKFIFNYGTNFYYPNPIEGKKKSNLIFTRI